MVSGLLALTIVVLLFRESAGEALCLWSGTRARGTAEGEAKQHPWWSVYAAGRPVVMIILIALPTGASLRGLGDTLL
jgi:hypothetical protein